MRSTKFIFFLFFFAGCASNPNKPTNVETKMEKQATINNEESLGMKDGKVIVQRKVLLSEELRNLEIEVYTAEDRIYGNRKYGSLGMYGVLKQCRLDLTDRKNGGNGKLLWTEPIDRLTEKDPDYKIGIDEKDDLVTVSEETIVDRIARFQKYQDILRDREDSYQEKLDICKAELSSRQFDKDSNRKAASANE